MKNYEGFKRDAPVGKRQRRVQATSPSAARKLLAETGHVLLPARKGHGPGWGASYR